VHLPDGRLPPVTEYAPQSGPPRADHKSLLPLEDTSTMSVLGHRVPSAEERAGWVHFTFPEAHRRQIRSKNPLERLTKELNDGDRRPASRGHCARAQGRLQVLTSCPRTCGRRSSTASPTGNDASSFRSRPWRSPWPPPWSRSCDSASRSLALATSISRIRPCSPSGQGRPSTVEC
jgi:hypothetical protein